MSTLTQKLARLGASGKHPNNVERDLFRVLDLPVAPFYVLLPTKCQSNRKDVVLTRVPVLLPHQVYHYMFEAWLYIVLFLVQDHHMGWKHSLGFIHFFKAGPHKTSSHKQALYQAFFSLFNWAIPQGDEQAQVGP